METGNGLGMETGNGDWVRVPVNGDWVRVPGNGVWK